MTQVVEGQTSWLVARARSGPPQGRKKRWGGPAFSCDQALRALSALLLAGWALGAAAQAPAPKLSDHVKADIERHRAMAAAHEAAARCLASGRAESDCAKDLQAACKGLAIGKYCGMKHAH